MFIRLLILIPAMVLAPLPTLAQTRASLQAACFPPEALASKRGENLVKRHVNTFDKAPSDLVAPPERAPIPPALRGVIRRVDLPQGDKSIALTFDLCEQRGEIAGYDGKIFSALRQAGVKATLFAGGKWMRSHADRTEQLIADPLFELAGHSATHRNLRKLSASDLSQEIIGPDADFRAARNRLLGAQCAANAAKTDIPRQLALFRFPFGACNAASLDAVNDAGFLAIQWSLSPGDPDPRESAKAIVSSVVKHIRPGDIVVLHANGRGWNTAEALPDLIGQLKARGFTFATLSELLSRGKPVVVRSCYDVRPGDTDRYDFAWSLARKKPGQSKPKLH